MIIEMIITHRAVFHSNSYLDNDNADDNVRIGITDNDDDVPQGCVSQQLTPSLSTSPHPASTTEVNKNAESQHILTKEVLLPPRKEFDVKCLLLHQERVEQVELPSASLLLRLGVLPNINEDDHHHEDGDDDELMMRIKVPIMMIITIVIM